MCSYSVINNVQQRELNGTHGFTCSSAQSCIWHWNLMDGCSELLSGLLWVIRPAVFDGLVCQNLIMIQIQRNMQVVCHIWMDEITFRETLPPNSMAVKRVEGRFGSTFSRWESNGKNWFGCTTVGCYQVSVTWYSPHCPVNRRKDCGFSTMW